MNKLINIIAQRPKVREKKCRRCNSVVDKFVSRKLDEIIGRFICQCPRGEPLFPLEYLEDE